MKILVVYYSRSGNTRKVAKFLAETLGGEIEEIKDIRKSSGILGYFLAIKDAVFVKKTRIQEIKRHPAKYNLIIIGTPVWALSIPPAIRTYLEKYKTQFPQKIAFFCTMDGRGASRAFFLMEKICGIKPVSLLSINSSELRTNQYREKIKKFIFSLTKSL